MVCTGCCSLGGGLFEGACGVDLPFDAAVLSSAAWVCVPCPSGVGCCFALA